MKNIWVHERTLIIAAVMLLLSILLMVVIIPGVYYNSIPNQTNAGAVIGISLAIFFRLLIFIWYISIIKKIRRDSKIRKAVYISIGVFLIIFGLIYSDGAFAFLNNKNILYVSFLMFISVFCDLIASILTFVALILSRKI